MVILGIDPGAKGGVSILDRGEYVAGMRMPVIKMRGKNLLDAKVILDFLTPYDLDTVVIEQVGSMPGQGVTSAFSFGRITGAIEATTMPLTDRMIWVTPAVWKKHFKLGKDKRGSLDAFNLRFGNHRLTKLADDGIAEAALIALYWAEQRF